MISVGLTWKGWFDTEWRGIAGEDWRAEFKLEQARRGIAGSDGLGVPRKLWHGWLRHGRPGVGRKGASVERHGKAGPEWLGVSRLEHGSERSSRHGMARTARSVPDWKGRRGQNWHGRRVGDRQGRRGKHQSGLMGHGVAQQARTGEAWRRETRHSLVRSGVAWNRRQGREKNGKGGVAGHGNAGMEKQGERHLWNLTVTQLWRFLFPKTLNQ